MIQMVEDKTETIRFIMGVLAFIAAMYMIYLSGQEGFTLNWQSLVTMLFLVTLLLYGPRQTLELINAWKGNDK